MEPIRFVFQGDKLWIGPSTVTGDWLPLPGEILALRVSPEEPVPEGVQAVGLRGAFGVLAAPDWARAGRAFQWLEWEAGHRFCGACATPLVPGEGHGRRCPACARQVFPAASTAIIVLIRRGPQLALARSPHFRPGVYSPVAGFTEPGESLEEAVHREVAEELAIRVQNLRYFGSQPWPFPNGLMVAFTAEHLEGELRPDGVEVEDARWFTPPDLPDLPSAISISRWLVDHALGLDVPARAAEL